VIYGKIICREEVSGKRKSFRNERKNNQRKELSK